MRRNYCGNIQIMNNVQEKDNPIIVYAKEKFIRFHTTEAKLMLISLSG